MFEYSQSKIFILNTKYVLALICVGTNLVLTQILSWHKSWVGTNHWFKGEECEQINDTDTITPLTSHSSKIWCSSFKTKNDALKAVIRRDCQLNINFNLFIELKISRVHLNLRDQLDNKLFSYYLNQFFIFIWIDSFSHSLV